MAVNPIYHQTKSTLLQERDWISEAKKDPEKFGPLYTKYHEQIFRYVYQRMDDQEQAFDVTSQVFIKALSNLHKYEFRGVPFSSWLYRIAKSELYQSFRDRKARRTVNVDTVHLADITEEFDDDELLADKSKLLKCLSQLRENDLQLIELRYFEKRPYKEIGEILDVTENNAKVKTFRALERLKKQFLK
ncbi:MAG: sigma-70 family RNA polymerase sigma factor [Flavobacteriales bacterium]|nr:sigma-70 family RNA polymerase sigma factor [Flavobacteriales bacterium]PIE86595.1 MAG: heat-shock protein [Bacteroidota bacterium]